jgi:hypothetical protein
MRALWYIRMCWKQCARPTATAVAIGRGSYIKLRNQAAVMLCLGGRRARAGAGTCMLFRHGDGFPRSAPASCLMPLWPVCLRAHVLCLSIRSALCALSLSFTPAAADSSGFPPRHLSPPLRDLALDAEAFAHLHNSW